MPTAAVPRGKDGVINITSSVDESPGWEMSLRGPAVGTADPRSQSRGSLRVDVEGEQRILVRGTGKQCRETCQHIKNSLELNQPFLSYGALVPFLPHM